MRSTFGKQACSNKLSSPRYSICGNSDRFAVGRSGLPPMYISKDHQRIAYGIHSPWGRSMYSTRTGVVQPPNSLLTARLGFEPNSENRSAETVSFGMSDRWSQYEVVRKNRDTTGPGAYDT